MKDKTMLSCWIPLVKNPSHLGVFWKFFSTVLFVVATCLVVKINKVGSSLPAVEIAFLQAAIPLGLLGLQMAFQRAFQKDSFFPHSVLTQDPLNALGRALCACVAFFTWSLSLKVLPLGVLAFFRLLGPPLTFGAALLLLKERASKTQLLAFVGTLTGAALLLHEDLSAENWQLSPDFQSLSLALPLITMIGFTGCNLFGKRLLQKVSPGEATFSLLALTSIGLSVFALSVWRWPTGEQCYLLLLMGLCDVGAQWSLSRALSLTTLSLLVPIGMWRFALLSLSGMLFFGEAFRLTLWIGVLLLSCMTALLLRKAPRALPPNGQAHT